MSLRAPFPYFGGKSAVAAEIWARLGDVPNYGGLWSGQSQFDGCRPTRLVVLLVDQRNSLRLAANAAVAFSRNAPRWIARCSDLLTMAKLDKSSFNLSSSLWWTHMPEGIGPLADAQTCTDLKTHVLGSAILTYARCSSPRLCRVLTRIEPTSNLCSFGRPLVKRPRLSRMLISLINPAYHTINTVASFGNQTSGRGRENALKETLWFSPHCIKAQQGVLL